MPHPNSTSSPVKVKVLWSVVEGGKDSPPAGCRNKSVDAMHQLAASASSSASV